MPRRWPTQDERIGSLERKVNALDGQIERMRRLESAVQTMRESWEELSHILLSLQSDHDAEVRFYDLVALICHAAIAIALIIVYAFTQDHELLLLIGGYLGGAAIQKVTTPTRKGS